jgi:branched-chain amino acid transport system permease protein
MWSEHWMLYMGPFLLLVVIFARRGLFGLLVGEKQDG